MSWKKFTAFNSSPTSQSYPELPENITYLRLFLGLAYGISLAFRENIPTTTLNGSIGLLFGLNVVTFIPIIYMNFYLNVDTDTYKGLNFAGVINGMALMVLIWVVFFTMLHEDEEKIFADALLKVLVDGNNGADSNISITEDSGSSSGNIAEDSEF